MSVTTPFTRVMASAYAGVRDAAGTRTKTAAIARNVRRARLMVHSPPVRPAAPSPEAGAIILYPAVPVDQGGAGRGRGAPLSVRPRCADGRSGTLRGVPRTGGRKDRPRRCGSRPGRDGRAGRARPERKSVGGGKSGNLGGRRI